MNAILNALHKRIFNLEITLQTNNQILNRSHTMIANSLSSPKRNTMIIQNQLSQELVRNSIDTSLQRSPRYSLIPDQHSLNLTSEKQLHRLNLSSHLSFEQTTIDSIDPFNNSLHSGFKKIS
jgi:hypothetical protein